MLFMFVLFMFVLFVYVQKKHNLAQPGTPSSSGITLVMDLIDYDAIIIQWTANDDSIDKFFGGDEGLRSKFESLIRSALNLPHQPAVIIFESLGTLVVCVFLFSSHRLPIFSLFVAVYCPI